MKINYLRDISLTVYLAIIVSILSLKSKEINGKQNRLVTEIIPVIKRPEAVLEESSKKETVLDPAEQHLPAPAPQQDYVGKMIWSANHEKGNKSEWSGNYPRGEVKINEVSKENPHSGEYSIKMTNSTGEKVMASNQYFDHFEVTGANVTEDGIYECWFYCNESFDLSPSNPSWDNLMQWMVKNTDGIGHPVFTIGFGVRGIKGQGGKNFLELRNAKEHFENTPSINIPELVKVDVPIKKWFRIRARYIQSATNGRVVVWQDDTKIYDVSNVITRPENDISGKAIKTLQWSCNSYNGGILSDTNTVTRFIDDAAIYLSPKP